MSLTLISAIKKKMALLGPWKASTVSRKYNNLSCIEARCPAVTSLVKEGRVVSGSHALVILLGCSQMLRTLGWGTARQTRRSHTMEPCFGRGAGGGLLLGDLGNTISLISHVGKSMVFNSFIKWRAFVSVYKVPSKFLHYHHYKAQQRKR